MAALAPGRIDSGLPWEILDRADAAEHLPMLRESLEDLTRFTNMIAGIAAGEDPRVCPECESRFYPSRSDARFCGGTCRRRAHRRQGRGEV
jgi:hypothetical protein